MTKSIQKVKTNILMKFEKSSMYAVCNFKIWHLIAHIIFALLNEDMMNH